MQLSARRGRGMESGMGMTVGRWDLMVVVGEGTVGEGTVIRIRKSDAIYEICRFSEGFM
jgi:hypothetical protein